MPTISSTRPNISLEKHTRTPSSAWTDFCVTILRDLPEKPTAFQRSCRWLSTLFCCLCIGISSGVLKFSNARKCNLHSEFSFFRSRPSIEGKKRCVPARVKSRPENFHALEVFCSHQREKLYADLGKPNKYSVIILQILFLAVRGRDRTRQVALTFCEICMQVRAAKAFRKF